MSWSARRRRYWRRHSQPHHGRGDKHGLARQAAHRPPDDVESLIESLVPQIAADRGFRVVGHTLDLVGACDDCGDQRGDLDVAAQDDP